MTAKETEEAFASRVQRFVKDVNMNSFERVAEFHRTFGHPISAEPAAADSERARLRLALILEESLELAEAMGYSVGYLRSIVDEVLDEGPVNETNLVGIADALGDIEYVVNGAALEYGIPLPAVVAEIHRSNMTKLGADGRPIYREDGKVLKGENYEPPNIEAVLA